MARIRTVKQPTCLRVVVTGKLRAADMRRLEHACAEALIPARPELVVDLLGVTAMDDVAAAHLRHLASRGRVLKAPS